jgi:O-antigen/teichoic acid export membrane protein
MALVAAMSPFASWGTSDVMIKHVARDRNVLPAYLGNAFLVTTVSGSLLTLFALLLRSRVLPASATATMLAAVAIAELLGAQTTTVCLHTFVALEQFRRYTQLLAWQTGVRFVAALVLAASTPTPLRSAYLYAASSIITAICGLTVVSRRCAKPRLQLNILVSSVREGFHFSTSTASRSIYNDIDKTMLARLSSVEAAAIYAVAYRLIEVAMLPIQCVAAATYPEFFRQGVNGVTSTFRFARKILRSSVLYGIATTVALYLAAGLVPLVFGQAYAESTVALRWLCPLPAIKSVHSFLTDTLTGANYQWQRSSSDIAMAVFNVLINLWIIRAYAWRGAAWSSLITDSLLAVLLYTIIRWHLRRERAAPGGGIGQPVTATGGE